MSFVFPEPEIPAYKPRYRSTDSDSDSESESDYDPDVISYFKNHRELTTNSEPDYDLLLVRLSLFAFNRLSLSDQREKVEEISHTANVEDVQLLEASDEASRLGTFAELLKKLQYSDQLKFLSKVIQKFKRERQLGELVSSFKLLDAEHQQQMIEKLVNGTPENLRNPQETEEEFRLRRFTQLSTYYTRHAYKCFVAARKDTDISDCLLLASDNKDGPNWKSCFDEFFLGFSVIWFQGQISSRQDMLIDQLAKGIKDVVIDENRLQDQSEEDFKLTRFTELCKKVPDFKIQEEFLKIAEEKLRKWGSDESYRMIVEPQDSDSMNIGAELLFHLSTFGFSLLSAKYQQQKIDEMSNLVESGLAIPAEDQTSSITESTDHEDGFRMGRFRELFNQVPISARLYIFQEFRKVLSQEKRYSKSIRLFRGLGSEDQMEMLESMFYQTTKSSSQSEKCDPAEVIVEKISGESEEDFRLRRFKKLSIQHISTQKNDISWPDDMKLLSFSDAEEYSPYDEFLIGEAIIWFKARCANHSRNPIERILYGKVVLGHTIGKLPEESEEDFRLRRFTESLKPLQLSSLECIHDYIEERLFYDLDHPKSQFACATKCLFDPEFVKGRLPGAAATNKQVEPATN